MTGVTDNYEAWASVISERFSKVYSMCPLCIAMNFLLRHLCVSWWNYSGTVCLLEYSSWTNCSAWNIWWSSTSPCIQVPVKTVEVMNRCSKNGKSAYSLLTANMLMCIVNIKVNCQKIVLWNSSPQDEASSYFPCTTSPRSPSLSYWTSTKSILSVLMMLQKKIDFKVRSNRSSLRPIQHYMSPADVCILFLPNATDRQQSL